jgi:hypothetical protein
MSAKFTSIMQSKSLFKAYNKMLSNWFLFMKLLSLRPIQGDFKKNIVLLRSLLRNTF